MKKKINNKQSYKEYGSYKEIWVSILVLIFGNILFSFTASLPTSLPMSSLFFHPAIISTSIFLAVASYFITSFTKTKN